MRRRWLVVGGATLAVLLVAGSHYLYAPRRTPAGQPPLASLSPGDLSDLRDRFNDAAGVPRVVALLSPT